MTAARARLAVAAALFAGWIGWLAYTVYVVRWAPGTAPVVSRAQLAAATHLVVADVAAGDDGLPLPTAAVVDVVRGDGVKPDQPVSVRNLPSALPPGANGFRPGRYLLPLVQEGSGFSVAGLPRSPGYEATIPTRPAIYPWADGTRAQLRDLGVMK